MFKKHFRKVCFLYVTTFFSCDKKLWAFSIFLCVLPAFAKQTKYIKAEKEIIFFFLQNFPKFMCQMRL